MPWPYLEVGHVVRIGEGPLRGLTGIVHKIKSGLKLVLSISLLQRSVAVEIDRAWISSMHGAIKRSPIETQTETPMSVGPMRSDSAKGLLGEAAVTDGSR
jgi:hypothetical protein